MLHNSSMSINRGDYVIPKVFRTGQFTTGQIVHKLTEEEVVASHKNSYFLPLWTELSRKCLGKDKSLQGGGARQHLWRHSVACWHDVAIGSGVMTLCFEQLKRHWNQTIYLKKRRGRKIINHFTPERTRESHPRMSMICDIHDSASLVIDWMNFLLVCNIH